MYIKGFDKNLKCRNFQFEVGKVYNTGYTEDLNLCSNTVFHFCDSLEKVHNYYDCSDEDNRYCEIEVLGEVVSDGSKMGSNKIKILREITGEELDLLKGRKNGNTGVFNTGYKNSGDDNSGDRNTGNHNDGEANSGNRNTGYCNTGCRNSGNFNAGDRNSGDFNTGYRNAGHNNTGGKNDGNYNSGYSNSGDNNTGDRNTGSWNSGDWNGGGRNSGYNNSGFFNSGDFNSGDYNTGSMNSGNGNSGYFNSCDGSSGIFCTEEPTVKIFDKDTNMTMREFRDSKYYKALKSSQFILEKWIKYTEEKKNDEERMGTSGYLKEYTYKEACANWWDKMTEANKKIVMSIPNFDADKFYEITGIRV